MIRIHPTIFKGTLEAPASKAHAQRLLMASSLPPTPTVVSNIPEADDIDTTVRCLLDFGCNAEKHGESEIKVFPFAKAGSLLSAEFNFRESGTTAHLALPIAAAFGIEASCKASAGLLRRTLLPLSSRMALRGVTFTSFNFPLVMKGLLQPGDYSFAGDEGSQYLSGALMALPLLREDSRILLSSPLADDSFISITLDTMAAFQVEVRSTDYGFYIPGKQFYKSPDRVSAENDWALGAMWACAGCLSRSDTDLVKVTGLPANSAQMYRDFKYVMAMLSHDVKYISIDARHSPNLACLYAVFAASKGAGADINGVPQLKFKETDRLKAVAECIKALGASARPTDDGIHIDERDSFNYREDTVLDCKGDPWIFMSFALAAGCLPKPVILSDERCAEKVYRGFLRDYEALGGKFEII